MDDAKENAVAGVAAPSAQKQQRHHPSWPLPSPHNTNSSSNNSTRSTKKQRRRRPPSSSSASVVFAASNVDDSLHSRLRRRRSVELLVHMAVVASVRDLASCLELLGDESTARAAKLAAEEALRANSSPERTLTQDEAYVALRVLEDSNGGRPIEVPAVSLPCCSIEEEKSTSNESGKAATLALLSTLYPEFATATETKTSSTATTTTATATTPPPTLVQLACSASMRRAEACLEALVNLLSCPPLLNPRTALSLLRVATVGDGGDGDVDLARKTRAAARRRAFSSSSSSTPATPIPRLAASARALAVSHFATAVQEDPKGLKSLSFATLLEVMEDDALAASEEEAFCAAALWAYSSPSSDPASLGDPPASEPRLLRAVKFPLLLSRGVRLSTMSREALFRLDSHQAVRGSAAATRAVARALISAFHQPRVPTDSERRQMVLMEAALGAPRQRRQQQGGGGGGGGEQDVDVENLEVDDDGQETRRREPQWWRREVVGIGVHSGRRATATAAAAAAAAEATTAAAAAEPTPCGPRGGAGEENAAADGSDEATPALPPSAAEASTLRTGRTMPPPPPSAAPPLSRPRSSSDGRGGGNSAMTMMMPPPPPTAASGAVVPPAAAAGAREATLTGCDTSPPRRRRGGEGTESRRMPSPRKRLCLE